MDRIRRRSRKASKRNVATRNKLRMEFLEQRVCLAASLGWDGPGLGAAELTYYIGDVPASVGLQQTEVESAIETALTAWSDVADITFTQTTLARQLDSLDITFTSIDGSGGVLAQAYLPDDVNRGRLAGDIEFDLADTWEIGNNAGRTAFDLVYVAAHEIGHALGLDHLNVIGSVMRPNVSPNQAFTALSRADETELLGVYAPAPVSSDPVDPVVVEPDAGGGNSTTTGGETSGDDTTGSGGQDTNDGDDDANNDTEERRRRGGRGRFGGFGHRGRSGTAGREVLLAGPSHHNSEDPADVNIDGYVTSLDVLTIINDLNSNGPRGLGFGEGEAGTYFSMLDVNGDNNVTSLDVLMVINDVNSSSTATITVEDPMAEADPTATDATVDDTATVEDPTTDAEQTPVDDTTMDEGSAAGDEMTETDETGVDDETAETETDDELAETEDTTTEDTATEEETADTDTETEDDASSEEDSTDETDESEDDDSTIDEGGVEEDREGCHHGGRDPFVRFDDNEDGVLSADEVPEALFDRLLAADADEDGAVSADEFEAYRSQHQKSDLFARFDANEDGFLTEDEVSELLWEKLLVGDADEDGAISPSELESIAIEHHRRDPFAMFDVNDDNVLTDDEVPEQLWEKLSQADADEDGVVTAEEFAAAKADRDEGIGRARRLLGGHRWHRHR